MHQSVIIQSKFNGPPHSANGGYVSGLLSSGIKGAAEVSLHAPPPLNTALSIGQQGEIAQLMQEEKLLGSALAKPLIMDVMPLPNQFDLGVNPAEADDAQGSFKPFGMCFVCGDERKAGDGLCIHSRRLNNQKGVVGAHWDLSFWGDEKGFVKPEFIWSALDCPGYSSCAPGEPALLGRFHAEIHAPLKAEGHATVLGWDMADSSAPKGRKRTCGTALYAPDGTLIANAKGLWVTVDLDYIKSMEVSG